MLKLIDKFTTLEELEALAATGTEMNQSDNGYNALHAAAEFSVNGVAKVPFLLLKGVNPNSQDKRNPFQNTPLHVYLANERFKEAEFFLEKIIEHNISLNYNLPDSEGKTYLLFSAKLRAESFSLKLLEKASTEINLDHQDKDGRTALHYACILNQPRLIEKLLALGANITIVDSQKMTAVKYLFCGKKEIWKTLDSVDVNWERDANASMNYIRDRNDQPPVFPNATTQAVEEILLLSHNSSFDRLKQIIADVPLFDTTPLMRGKIKMQSKEEKQYYLTHFENFIGKSLQEVCMESQNISIISYARNCYDHGWLLRKASAINDYNILQELLELSKEHVNTPGKPSKMTPLHYAAKFNSFECLQLLVKHGAVIVEDAKGLTALDYAKRTENPSMVTFLENTIESEPANACQLKI